jgi:hypothetical protein
LSPKANNGEKAAKQPKEQPNKPEPLKSSGASKAEASKTPLPPHPAQSPVTEQKPTTPEAQPDIMANWRPARPQPRPTQAPTQDTPAQKLDAPQAPRGPVVPPLAPAQPSAPQQAPIQPDANPGQQPPQAQQPAKPTDGKNEEPDGDSNNDKTDNKSKQQKPDDQQTMETNYQDEITRLLDELSNDSSKS